LKETLKPKNIEAKMSDSSHTILEYRRALENIALKKANIELEARLTNVDFYMIESIYKSLMDFNDIKHDGLAITIYKESEISQTLDSIAQETPELKTEKYNLDQHDTEKLIMTMEFKNGKKQKIGSNDNPFKKFSRKWKITHPVRVRNSLFSYSLNVSGEQDLETAFVNDSNSLIRIKNRNSYYVNINEHKWRVDLTVVKQFPAFNSKDIKKYVDIMFKYKEPVTSKNFMESMNLGDPEMQQLFSYEIEVEYMKDSGVIIDTEAITNVIKFISWLAKPSHTTDTKYQETVYDVAKYIVTDQKSLKKFKHDYGIKQLLPSVTALTINTYKHIFPPVGFFILEKYDGDRSTLIIKNNTVRIISKKYYEFQIPTEMKTTIVDGELMTTIDKDGEEHITLAIFDVMVIDGSDISEMGYEIRIINIEEAVDIINGLNLDKFKAETKFIEQVSDPNKLEQYFNNPELSNDRYNTDGLILVKPENNYLSTISYKWKPIEDNTIDFLAKKVPKELMDTVPVNLHPKKGFDLYYLFVGINPNMFQSLGMTKVAGYDELFPGNRYESARYFPIQFSPSDSPFAYIYYHNVTNDDGNSTNNIDGKYVEMRCNDSQGTDNECVTCEAAGKLDLPKWEFIRLREDRAREKNNYFGNDFRTAEVNWSNYLAPFKKEQLWTGPNVGYFAVSKSSLYKYQTGFTSFVKTQRIQTLSHFKWVIDAAIGKGQDFLRYVDAEIKYLIGIDLDQTALTELIQRKLQNASRISRIKNNPLTLFILNKNLTDPYTEFVTKIQSITGFPKKGANALVINLAIHYLCGSTENIQNFIQICSNLVEPGGIVSMTLMFGETVHQMLIDNEIKTGEAWKKYEGDTLKYSIRRDYKSDTMTDVGQQIGVLLPFSVGEYYEEPIVNTKYLESQFNMFGFKLVEKKPFNEHFNEHKIRNPNHHKMLTPEDFEFLSLYGEMVFQKDE
jgi:hypothetical protein